MEKCEKYYIAGIWDADGSFGVTKRVKRWESFQPFAIITLCDPKAKIIGEIIEEYFGFKCVWKSRRDNPKWKMQYRWQLSSQKACDFAGLLYPYLRIKKERAKILMEWPTIKNSVKFIERIPIHEKQRELYERMKKLNKRGA